MKALLTLIFFASLSASTVQSVDIKPYIRAWNISDETQSLKAQVFYDSLKFNRDTVHYNNVVNALYAYLKKNDNRRLRVRTMMYEALGAREYELLDNKENASRIMDAIKLAYPLKDEQLNAELYALYADMFTSQYEYILYNLKALEIQRKIGLNHFDFIQNRFYGASDVLYRAGDYRKSIEYGKEGFSLWSEDIPNWDRRIYIMQMDILGANYRKLGMYDSTFFYYQKIHNTLTNNPLSEPTLQKIWMGIAKGNIGMYDARKKDYGKAMPLMHEYLTNSIEVKDSFNIAIAENNLGAVLFEQQKYAQAMAAWQHAGQISSRNQYIDQAIQAYEGIAQVFRKTGNVDSAFYYYDLYLQSKEELQEYFRESNYANVSARLAFDNLQNSFDKIEFDYIKIRNTRNAIIASIVLLTIIAALLYNRKRLKDTIRLQEVQQKYHAVQMEAYEAKSQMEFFKRNVAEKEKVIKALSLKNDPKSAELKKELEHSLEQFTLVFDDNWQAFRIQFLKAYPAFGINLRQKIENLSPAEEKLAFLIYLQLNNSQLSHTLGISIDSVARAKRRLKSRLSINSNDALDDAIQAL